MIDNILLNRILQFYNKTDLRYHNGNVYVLGKRANKDSNIYFSNKLMWDLSLSKKTYIYYESIGEKGNEIHIELVRDE